MRHRIFRTTSDLKPSLRECRRAEQASSIGRLFIRDWRYAANLPESPAIHALHLAVLDDPDANVSIVFFRRKTNFVIKLCSRSFVFNSIELLSNSPGTVR